MPADNLEVFKKVIFSLPSLRQTLALSIATSLLYSLSIFYLFEKFLINVNGYVFIPLLTLGLFIIPSIISSELYHYFLPKYPRKWGYFLALVNQLIIFLFTLLVTLADNFYTGWQIIWLGLTTLFINNFLILVLSTGPKNVKRVGLLSLIQPLFILGGFHLMLGAYLQIGFLAYASNFLVVLSAGLVLLIAIYVTEFLVGSNVSNISILGLATALLQNRQEKLELGFPVNPDVQTMEIENESGKKTFVVPWLHPGPLEGFGGGRITNSIMEEINREGEGFFLHIPSCHNMDPADPGDSKKVMNAVTEPEKTGKATKLIEKEYDFVKFYGRRIGDKKIVFMDVETYDDYGSAIFSDFVNKDDVLLVDLHNQPEGSRLGKMQNGTADADQVREDLEDFVKELEEQEVHEYKAGFEIQKGVKPVMGLVGEVNNQKTLLFGIEGNDASENLLELREEFKSRFDKVLLFTTDTHASIHDLAGKMNVEKDLVRAVVNSAEEDVSEASIGFSNKKAEEMNFLKEDYHGLIYTINILVRLIPITLVVLYVALAAWLL